ncbi:MAG: nucleotide sugar dehydrogenase [Candidatus Methanomethylophilaceae archaeon]|nr:nucleotide sugar dehydrogenase [Candidatus Methanomethylophilaceae archaeon]
MKFCIVGTGYVGLSLSTLLARKYKVVAVDIVPEKVELINSGKSPIVDKEISEALASGKLDLKATTDINECAGADFVIIATPTNYDPAVDHFDTGSVDSVIKQVTEIDRNCTIVVKSTVPIGYVAAKRQEGFENVIFSPEFLREGKALYDNLHPSRIIAGIPSESLRGKAEDFVNALASCADEKDVPVLVMPSTEAESVKLFSNTYLAMRVAFFNELDSFAAVHNLDPASIIKGVSLDPRIGDYYNNPSFGYGGYCLPKDTKQLLSNYHDVPNDLVKAIVYSNDTRKKFIANRIMERSNGGKVGIYRLSMKSDSDNYRESSIISVMEILKDNGTDLLIYEPTYPGETFHDVPTTKDLDSFLSDCSIILANRMDKILERCPSKVFTRDLMHRD